MRPRAAEYYDYCGRGQLNIMIIAAEGSEIYLNDLGPFTERELVTIGEVVHVDMNNIGE